MTSRRDALLHRLAGQRGPSDPELHEAWRRLPASQRHRLRWTATDPTAAAHLHDDLARDLVDALAADRAQRRRWDVVVPPLVAVLVLATLWGFGRAVFPASAGWFLLAGVAAGVVTTVVGWRRRARVRADARAVRQVLRRR